MGRFLNYCILTALFFTSCGTKHPGEKKTTLASHLLGISDNEDKGIKEIIGLYGGECEYGFSKSTGNNTEPKNAFWLEVRKSETIDESEVKPELIGSNIAYLFYRNLNEEKNKYAEIQVKVKRTNKENSEFSYPASVLEVVARRHPVLDQIFSYIKNKDFKTLGDHIALNPAVGAKTQEEMINNIKGLEERLGAIKELIPYGFRFIKSEDGNEVLYLAGIVVRENENHPFSVVLDSKSNDDKVYLINYVF
jgi:hypothetical protein